MLFFEGIIRRYSKRNFVFRRREKQKTTLEKGGRGEKRKLKEVLVKFNLLESWYFL